MQVLERPLERPRDQNGWRIPRPGTKSEQIYNLAKSGKWSKQIAEILAMSPNSVRVLLWKIRNPENSNARERKQWKRDHAHY